MSAGVLALGELLALVAGRGDSGTRRGGATGAGAGAGVGVIVTVVTA